MTSSWSVIFPALLAAGCFAIFEYGGKSNLWAWLGWFFILIAMYFAAVILVERDAIQKVADAISRVKYREVAMAYAVSGMNNEQVRAWASRYLIEPDTAIIRQDGVELDPDWVIRFLQKSSMYFPEYPSYRDHKEESKAKRDNIVEYSKQRALRNYLRATGRTRSRNGQMDEWINGNDPQNTLEALGYDRR